MWANPFQVLSTLPDTQSTFHNCELISIVPTKQLFRNFYYYICILCMCEYTHMCLVLRPQCVCGDQSYFMEIHSPFYCVRSRLRTQDIRLGHQCCLDPLCCLNFPSSSLVLFFVQDYCDQSFYSNPVISSETKLDSSCCGILSCACKRLMKLSRKSTFVAFTERKIKCKVKLSWVSP